MDCGAGEAADEGEGVSCAEMGTTGADAAESAATANGPATAEMALCVWDPSDTALNYEQAETFLVVTFGTPLRAAFGKGVWYEIVSAAHAVR